MNEAREYFREQLNEAGSPSVEHEANVGRLEAAHELLTKAVRKLDEISREMSQEVKPVRARAAKVSGDLSRLIQRHA